MASREFKLTITCVVHEYGEYKVPLEDLKEVLQQSTWEDGRVAFSEELIHEGICKKLRQSMYHAIWQVVCKIFPTNSDNHIRYRNKLVDVRNNKTDWYIGEVEFGIEPKEVVGCNEVR